MKIAKIENYLIILMGLWLCSIPWSLGFGFGDNDINVVMWNFLMVGGTVITTSIIYIKKLKIWTGWLSLLMGVWMVVSPLFLVYYKYELLVWHSVVFGLLISAMSALSIRFAEKTKIYKRIAHSKKISLPQ